MAWTIRPFTSADYEHVVAIDNTLYPDLQMPAEDMIHQDEHRPAHCKCERWVAEQDGSIVGWAEYTQHEGRYHPQKFYIGVSVHPEYQGRGIGPGLYETLLNALAPYDPIALNAQVRETQARGLQFVEKRGFLETMRTWESELDLANFDPAPWLPAVERATAQGIAIRTLRDLESDPERNRKLHDAISAIRPDVPSPDPATPLDFDTFINTTLSDPAFLPEGYFVAVAPDGQYAGVSALWQDSGDGVLWTGLTGLRREYRGMSVAQALKVTALQWAKAQGKKGVRTFNASNNARMLAINIQMGFARKPAWIDFRLMLKDA